jgi:hypothetical protein
MAEPSNTTNPSVLLERVAEALEGTAFNFSIELTRLVDGVSTYTLTTSDGSREFPSHQDAYDCVSQQKRQRQARAVLAVALEEAAKAVEALPENELCAIDNIIRGIAIEDAAAAIRALKDSDHG